MFPPVQTDERYDYKAIILTKESVKVVAIENQKWNYHFIQPIDHDHILLVSARAECYDNGKFDRNARVFDSDGNLLREFLLGDGIQNLYVTKDNKIWTSYFDEGIFGNYGWTEPIGSDGLRAWDSEGTEIYKYPNGGSHFIDDCYALNVIADEEVWFYFYSEFELARYYRGNIEYFKPDVKGADGFTVFKDYVLFRGGYDNHDRYTLFQLIPGRRLQRKCFLSFIDDSHNTIKADHVSCRGSHQLLTFGNKAYLIDLRSIISENII